MIAVFCEGFQADGGIISVQRIVDTYYVDLSEVPAPRMAVFQIQGIIGFKAASKTKGTVTFKLRMPNGNVVTPDDRRNFELNGGESGAVMNLHFNVIVPEYGVYWLDVFWDEERMTSMSYRIATPPAQTPQTTSEQKSD